MSVIRKPSDQSFADRAQQAGAGGATRAAQSVPRFDLPLVPDGYAWWYVDALSDAGDCGLTVIGMLGNVFSPYYAAARRLEPADPEQYCALNVALYGPQRKRWAMTERGAGALQRSAAELTIGPSSMQWRDGALLIDIDEITVPIPGRLRGQIRLFPGSCETHEITLDEGGNHHWWPLAPRARVEVDMERPDLRWSGTGYLDSNRGSEPLERRFRRWDWFRAPLQGGDSAVLYNTNPLREAGRTLAFRFRDGGAMEPVEPPPPATVATTGIWRIPRPTRSGPGARVRETLEDTPFYARSVLDLEIFGEQVTGVHESLSLERFSQAWVRTLLPFRMPRRPGPPRR